MREGQQDMSFEIVDALINDQHFAIEAGVGIGKSFGYLVPVPVSYTHLVSRLLYPSGLTILSRTSLPSAAIFQIWKADWARPISKTQ